MKNPKDKVTLYFEGVKFEITYELLQKQRYEENDDGTYTEVSGSFRMDKALELEPEGFFTETILYEYKSGYTVTFDSNYKLSKEEQAKVNEYHESDDPDNVNVSGWICYYDRDDKQTFDKKLINIIDQERDTDDDYGSPNGNELQRLDPDDFLKDMSYYWG